VAIPDLERNNEMATASLPMIEVYSTLTKKKAPLVTVKRYLEYSGWRVTWVVNITDVDDKIIAESTSRGTTMAKLAEEMTADYLENLASLGVKSIDEMPKATEHIGTIIAFIEGLIAKDCAYASDGDVYFDVTKDADYGKLTNRSIDQTQGDGGSTAERKRSAADFALWKKAKAGEPSWESPWGPGRPGWHIECSAMSKAILGPHFDIHGGGLDLVFPHHENEMAQSESLHDCPMATFWMHNGLMQAAGAAGKVGGRPRGAGEAASAAGFLLSSACWSMNLLTTRTKSKSEAIAIAVLKSSSIAARNFSRNAFTSSPAAATAASPARRSRQGRA